MTRDEHLLFVVLALVILDLAVLIPWTIIDGLHCRLVTITEEAYATGV